MLGLDEELTPDKFIADLSDALLVGVSFAKSLAFGLGVPLIPVHHVRGHIAANYIAHPDLKPPFLCLVASGGHSHIIEVKSYNWETLIIIK